MFGGGNGEKQRIEICCPYCEALMGVEYIDGAERFVDWSASKDHMCAAVEAANNFYAQREADNDEEEEDYE